MKFLFDFIPIIAFFLLYKQFGIFVATATTAAIAVLQTILYWLKHRRFDYLLLGSTLLIVILASVTLIFRDEMFIKWKPTAISWLFAVAFLASQLFGKKPLIQLTLESIVSRTQEQAIILPQQVWQHLNLFWILFYTLLGFVNLFVIYHYDTDTWVNFKLFGMLGLTFAFVLAQALYLSRQLSKHSHE